MTRLRLAAALSVVTMSALTGCAAHEQRIDAAIAQAKVQAAQSGVPQQVAWSDLSGNVYKVVVQPPLPGQTKQAVSRSVGGQAGNPRALAPVTNTPWGPVITPAPVEPNGGTTHSK